MSRHHVPGMLCALLLCGLAGSLSAADKYDLHEPLHSTPQKVKIQLSFEGQLQTAATAGKAIALKLTGGGDLIYTERRLKDSLREAQEYRGLRVYESPTIKIQVAETTTVPGLRTSVRTIVAEGQSDGVRFSSPAGPLTFSELELLRAPLDSLAALALLPNEEVEVGEKWTAPNWVLPFLTSTEAVEKSELNCKLEEVNANVARVSFSGEIKGGILGAASEIKVEGDYLYDLTAQRLVQMTLTQTESRSVGVISPGLKLTAKVTLTRQPAEDHPLLTDAALEAAESPVDAKGLALVLEAPEWGVNLTHERRWHIFHQSPTVAVLRFVDRGSLLAQCNVSPIGPAKAGDHISEKQFQQDVQQAIGADFRKLESAEVVPPKQTGLFIYRVVASGETRQANAKKEVQVLPVQWMYFLVAHPDGRQMVLVFTIENELLEKFERHDFELAWGLAFEMLKPQAETPATKP